MVATYDTATDPGWSDEAAADSASESNHRLEESISSVDGAGSIRASFVRFIFRPALILDN